MVVSLFDSVPSCTSVGLAEHKIPVFEKQWMHCVKNRKDFLGDMHPKLCKLNFEF
jgi:hypothetical protein